MISLLALALTLQPADLTFVEPLRLTSGVEVNATYSAPIDSLCLTLEDFVLVKLDMAEAVTAIEGRGTGPSFGAVCVTMVAMLPSSSSVAAGGGFGLEGSGFKRLKIEINSRN